MDRAQLLKKLEPLLGEFDRARMFGSIEIVFRFVRAFSILTTDPKWNQYLTKRHLSCCIFSLRSF